MTAILRGGFRREPLLILPERPRRQVDLDINHHIPTGGTIVLSPGADIGQAVYDHPDSTIECIPGFYPKFKWRKPPGHGWNIVRPSGTLFNRQYTPADIASGIQVIPDGDYPSWQDSQIEGEIPYQIHAVGLHPGTPPNSTPGSFFGIAQLAANDPVGLKLSNLPWSMVLDRCVHTMPSSSWRRWGFLANGIDIGAINCWFGPAHYNVWPAGNDSNGLNIFQGPGPYTFKKCFIAGAEENFGIGDYGNTVGRPLQARIGDITFDECQFYRYRTNRGVYQCKNGFEFKQVARIEVTNFIIENSWSDVQQEGYGIIGWTAGAEWYQATHDVIFENGWIKNVPGVANFSPNFHDIPNPPMKRVKFSNIVVTGFCAEGVTNKPSDPSYYHDRAFELPRENNALQGLSVCNDVLIERVMVFTSGRGKNELFRVAPQQFRNLRIKNNIFGVGPGGYYGPKIFTTGDFEGNPAWNQVAGVGAAFSYNAIVDPSSGPTRITSGPGVTGNQYFTDRSQLGLVNQATLDNANAVVADLANLALSPSSVLKGTGEGGSDPGPDFALLTTNLANVRAAVP